MPEFIPWTQGTSGIVKWFSGSRLPGEPCSITVLLTLLTSAEP